MSFSITGAAQGTMSGFMSGASTGLPHAAGIGAVLGGLFGGFGGGSGGGGPTGMGKKTKAAIRANNKLQIENLENAEAEAIQLLDQAEILYNDEAHRAYGEALLETERINNQRVLNFNEQHDLFTDSRDAARQSVKLTDIAATIAINDTKRVYNDRIYELGNNQMSIVLNQEANNLSTALEQTLIRDQFASSIQSSALNAQGIKRQTVANIRMADEEIDVMELDMEAQANRLTAEAEAASDNIALSEKQIFDSLDTQIKQSDFAQQTIQLQQNEKRAEGAIQTVDAIRQGLIEQSAQIAKGQAGRSALKSVQGLAFKSGQAQKLIASAITRADAKFFIDKQGIAAQLESARNQASNALESEAIKAGQVAAQFGIANLEMQSKAASLDINKERITGMVKMANVDIDKISTDLLSTQKSLDAKYQSNELSLAQASAQTALSLESIDYARQSAAEQGVRDREQIRFDRYKSNLAAQASVLDEPVIPDLLPPPSPPPEFIRVPVPEIDYDKLDKIAEKNAKARMSVNLQQMDPGFAQLGNLALTALDSASQVYNAYKSQNSPINNNNNLFQSQGDLPFTPPDMSFDIGGQNGIDYSPPPVSVDFNAPVGDFDLGFDSTPTFSTPSTFDIGS